MHTYMPTYIRTPIHTIPYTSIHKYIHTYIHASIHTSIHTSIHPYTTAYIHTPTKAHLFRRKTHNESIHPFIESSRTRRQRRRSTNNLRPAASRSPFYLSGPFRNSGFDQHTQNRAQSIAYQLISCPLLLDGERFLVRMLPWSFLTATSISPTYFHIGIAGRSTALRHSHVASRPVMRELLWSIVQHPSPWP